MKSYRVWLIYLSFNNKYSVLYNIDEWTQQCYVMQTRPGLDEKHGEKK